MSEHSVYFGQVLLVGSGVLGAMAFFAQDDRNTLQKGGIAIAIVLCWMFGVMTSTLPEFITYLWTAHPFGIPVYGIAAVLAFGLMLGLVSQKVSSIWQVLAVGLFIAVIVSAGLNTFGWNISNIVNFPLATWTS